MEHRMPEEDGWQSRELRSGEELPFFALMRNGIDLKSCVLPDNTILHSVYGSAVAGDPYRAWVLRSEDAGESWEMVTMAYDGGEHPFNESSLLRLPGGRIVALAARRGQKCARQTSGDTRRTCCFSRTETCCAATAIDGSLTGFVPACLEMAARPGMCTTRSCCVMTASPPTGP